MDERIRSGLKELRGFGIGLGVFLCFFALLSWRRGTGAWRWELPVAGLSWLLAAFAPSAFGPLYRLWMPAALFLGKVNTYVFLSSFYWFTLTPYAWFLKLLGNRMLDLELRDRDSYWVPKEPVESLDAYRRQF